MNIDQRVKSLLDMIDTGISINSLSDIDDIRLPEMLKGREHFLESAVVIDYRSKIGSAQTSNFASLEEQLEIAVQILLNKGLNIILCPTGWSDIDACKRFKHIFQNNNVLCLDRLYSIEEIAGIIQRSKLCISMSKETSIFSAALCKPFFQIACDKEMLVIAEKLVMGDLSLNVDNLNAGKIIKGIDYISDTLSSKIC